MTPQKKSPLKPRGNWLTGIVILPLLAALVSSCAQPRQGLPAPTPEKNTAVTSDNKVSL
jgi:hypothetical protein